MSQTLKEKKIIRGILLYPILSLFILSVLLFSSLYFYFNQFKNEEIQEYKTQIIQDKENLTKNMLLSLVADINHDLVDLNHNIKLNLKNRIDEAQKIINRVIKNNPNKSKKELKILLKQILSAIRYNNGRGYYFVYNQTTKINLIHPIKKFINKNMSDFQDKRGTYILKVVDKIINQKGQGYATIYFEKPSNPNKEFKKIIYVKYIPKLNWVIGTGEYIDDAMNEFKKELLEEITAKRYGSNGYFWVHNTHYILLAHPFRQKDIGKDDTNLTDIKGQKIIQLFVKKAKEYKNGTFVTYYWQNPKTKKIEKKISFLYYLPKFDWVIGTGLYLNDLQPLIEKRTKQISSKINHLLLFLLFIILFVSLIMIIILYTLSQHTKTIFEIYKNDLEHKIEQAVNENIKKDKILQEQSKLAAMGEMIGAIAHQWRQPLNALGLNIQLLIEDFEDNKIDEKYLEEFEQKQMETIKFMSKTIDDFRNFFKSDKEKSKFSVLQSINEVIFILSAQLNNHNIEISIKGDDFEINGYKSEFNQVILNLINNAKDSILEKGVEGKIEIILKNNSIIITDNGKEIPDEIKDRIFEPYFTTKSEKGGTGIGLYMSKMIIERMGGELILEKPKKFIIKGLK